MLEIAVWVTTVLLVITKIPDVVTTWRGVVQTRNPGLEQNPIARAAFLKYGLGKGMFAVCAVFLLLIAASVWSFYLMDGWERALWGVVYIVQGLFTCLLQLQAAWYNTHGVMPQPLRSVHRMLRFFYSRRSGQVGR
jgi:hypothetical protein